jgi:hypothetical protein
VVFFRPKISLIYPDKKRAYSAAGAGLAADADSRRSDCGTDYTAGVIAGGEPDRFIPKPSPRNFNVIVPILNGIP